MAFTSLYVHISFVHKTYLESNENVLLLKKCSIIEFSNLYIIVFVSCIESIVCIKMRPVFLFCWKCHVQMRADAMTHHKYWFRISSILERTKNGTKTSNTSFERSDCGLLKSWRFGAWHSYWPAMPTLYDKLNFLGEEGVASPWCCHAPVLQEFFCPLSGLSNEILYVFLPFLLFL